jgi:hypothetical protein
MTYPSLNRLNSSLFWDVDWRNFPEERRPRLHRGRIPKSRLISLIKTYLIKGHNKAVLNFCLIGFSLSMA